MLAIEINGLRLVARLGVPEEERSRPQTIEADVKVRPMAQGPLPADELGATIDYEALANRMRQVAAERPRKLLETLAEDLTSDLLATYPLDEVRLCLRKFILPGTNHVAVRLVRRKKSPGES